MKTRFNRNALAAALLASMGVTTAYAGIATPGGSYGTTSLGDDNTYINTPATVYINGNNDNSGAGEGVRINSQANADNANGAYISVVGDNNRMQAVGENKISGATNTVLGTTSINASYAADTSINTGTSTGNVTVGNAANTTSLNSATNNIGHTNFATVNNIGNATAATQVNAQAGNAKMTLANDSAVLTVPSGAAGVNNGVAVDNTKASITGGTTSPTRMTMTDNAATFSRVSNGAPITVTGVADGKNDFDAVNVRQFAGAVAAVAAQANIPALAAGQNKTVGVGVGNFMGKTGLALGMNLRGEGNTTYKLSVSTGLNGGAKTVIGGGAAWSF